MTIYLDISDGPRKLASVRVEDNGSALSDRCHVDDDVSTYWWEFEGISGPVEHRRSEGLLKLAQLVFDSMLGDRDYVS